MEAWTTRDVAVHERFELNLPEPISWEIGLLDSHREQRLAAETNARIISELEASRAQLATAKANTEQQLVAQHDQLEATRLEAARTLGDLEKARNELATAQAEAGRSQQQLVQAQRELAGLRAEVRTSGAALEVARRELAAAKDQTEQLLGTQREQLEAARSEVALIRAEAERWQKQLNATQNELTRLQAVAARAGTDLEAARSEAATARSTPCVNWPHSETNSRRRASRWLALWVRWKRRATSWRL